MDYSDRGNLQQLFVDSLSDYALVVLDVDGKVLTWNAGASAMLGYAESEVIGRHFSCLYTQTDIDAGKPLMSLAGALAQGRHDDTGQRLHKDGTRLETQSVLIPLYDPEKKLVAFGNLTREIGATTPAAAAPVAAVTATEVRATKVRKKVLLVDDDEAVRTAAVGLLENLGYEVVVASGGAEALDMLTRIDDIDVLFTDVIMPGGMDGGEVAERAQALRPDLKFLFASGYFEAALVRKGTISASTHFLVKPYRKRELALKMEQVLGPTVAAVPAAV
jgi:PAS domain S-box-containing protein